MNTTLKSRLKAVASYNGLSIRAMEEKCGLSRSVIGNMSETGVLGSDKLSKILDTFRDIDPLWLISGEGNMLKEKPQSNNSEDADCQPIKNMRPRLPINAAAGALSNIAECVTDSQCDMRPLIPAFADYDFTIPIEGDSMLPDYQSGDELACVIVNDISEIKWGKPYVVDSTQGIVFKRIYDGGSHVLCRSINPTGSEYEIDKEEIIHIAAIVGSIRRSQNIN